MPAPRVISRQFSVSQIKSSTINANTRSATAYSRAEPPASKNLVAAISVVFIFAFAPALHATITSAPTAPKANESVTLTVSGTWPDSCAPTYTGYNIAGTTINVASQANPSCNICLFVVTPYSFNVPIGPLSAGTYTINFSVTNGCAGTTLQESRLLTVAPLTTGNLLANPGFATSLSGWTTPSSSTVVSFNLFDADSVPGSGSVQLRLTTGVSGCQIPIYQIVPITPQTTYTLSGKINATAMCAGCSANVGVYFSGDPSSAVTTTGVTTGASGFRTVSRSVTSPASVSSAQVFLSLCVPVGQGPQVANFDDIYFGSPTATCTPPAITTQPTSRTITIGSSTNLTVSATGTTPRVYQWYTGTSGNTAQPIAGATSTSLTVSPTVTTRYWVRVENACGSVNSSAATVSVDAPPTATFSANPTSIQVGDATTLSWTTTNADSVSIGGIGPVDASGSMKVYPQVTTTYTLTAKNPLGEVTKTVVVTVTPAPSQPVLATITAIPNEIMSGESITLTWEASGATDAVINEIGAVDLSGSRVIPLTATTTFVLNASNSTSFGSASALVTVRTVPKPRAGEITPSSTSITQGQSVLLFWTFTGASSASIDGADAPVSGSRTVTPRRTTTYTLKGTGEGGSTTRTTTVTVDSVPPPRVSTPAGKPGQSGSSNGTGESSRFNNPAALGVDGLGNLFLIDSGNHTIRRISATGVTETWAGQTGVRGFRDGFRASALFDFSNLRGALLVNTDGSLVVSDASNRIRYVDASGLVRTCETASCARFALGGMATDSQGNRYDADSGSNSIRKVTPVGQDTIYAGQPGMAGYRDGPAGQALFRGPRGIGVDNAGNVYVGDTGNNAIRKISPAGFVTTLAGGPVGKSASSAATASPFSFGCCGGQLAVDPKSGTVYVTDPGSNTIKQVDLNGMVTTVVGSGKTDNTGADGSASEAGFNNPSGIARKPDGSLFISDTANHTVRATSAVTPVASRRRAIR